MCIANWTSPFTTRADSWTRPTTELVGPRVARIIGSVDAGICTFVEVNDTDPRSSSPGREIPEERILWLTTLLARTKIDQVEGIVTINRRIPGGHN